MGPKSTGKCPYQEEKRRRPCEDGDKDWSYASTSRRMLGATSSWKWQGEVLPPGTSEGVQPCQHVDFRLVASEL